MMIPTCLNLLNRLHIGLGYLPTTGAQKFIPALCGLHTSALLMKVSKGDIPEGPKKWPAYNKKVYPPQEPGEPRRPAWVCHHRADIKYSPQKMWYIACMIRGMSIDEAIKQLSFVAKKGAPIIAETLLEAQELALREHNVEYKSNLWIAESFVGRSIFIKGFRRHARARFGKVEYRYCHYFVKLLEGPPPKHYYTPELTGNEKLAEYISNWRDRRIVLTL